MSGRNENAGRYEKNRPPRRLRRRCKGTVKLDDCLLGYEVA